MIQTTEALPDIVEAGIDSLVVAEIALATGLAALQARTFRSSKSLERANTFTPERTEYIAGYAEQTLDYMYSENIGAIALMDGAARPFAHPLLAAWHHHFDGQEDAPAPPSIFFVNPQGFESQAKIAPIPLLTSLLKPLLKGDRFESPLKRRKHADVQTRLPEQLPGLYERREQPLLVFDNCVHSGRSVKPVLAGLAEAGFTNVHFGVVHGKQSGREQSIQPDLVLSSDTPPGSCYPFGIDKLTEKTYVTPYSRASTNAKRQSVGSALRANLKTALAAHYTAK